MRFPPVPAHTLFSQLTLTLAISPAHTRDDTVIDGPAEKATATKEEMLHYLDQMLTIRRFEIVNDSEYKMRNIRGFCHLYDGQEAIAVGTQAALTNDDSWITTYRCHATAFVRGSPVHEIFGELFGLDNGVVAGRGGSMHMYNKKNNFYGGAAIVGAQVSARRRRRRRHGVVGGEEACARRRASAHNAAASLSSSSVLIILRAPPTHTPH